MPPTVGIQQSPCVVVSVALVIGRGRSQTNAVKFIVPMLALVGPFVFIYRIYGKHGRKFLIPQWYDA